MAGGNLRNASFPEGFHFLALFESEWRVEAQQGAIRFDAVNVHLDNGRDIFAMFRGGESGDGDLFHYASVNLLLLYKERK